MAGDWQGGGNRNGSGRVENSNYAGHAPDRERAARPACAVAAEQWLERPAIGLDQWRPIDLMTTPAGLELVEDFLGRIEYGVYT